MSNMSYLFFSLSFPALLDLAEPSDFFLLARFKPDKIESAAACQNIVGVSTLDNEIKTIENQESW